MDSRIVVYLILLTYSFSCLYGQSLPDLTGMERNEWFLEGNRRMKSQPEQVEDEIEKILVELDSVEHGNDFAACHLLLGRIYRLRLVDLDKARKHLSISAKYAYTNQDTLVYARALRNMGSIFISLGQWGKADSVLQKAVDYLRHTREKSDLGFALNSIAIVNKESGDFGKALLYLEEALEFAEESGSLSLPAYLWNTVGTCYDESGELQKAVDAYEKSMYWLEKLGDQADIATSWINQARILDRLGRGQQSMILWNKALAVFEEQGQPWRKVTVLINRGSYLLGKGNLDDAMDSYLEAYKLAQTYGYISDEFVLMRGIGKIAYARGNHEEALRWLYQSLYLATPGFQPEDSMTLPPVEAFDMGFEAIHNAHRLGIIWFGYFNKSGDGDALLKAYEAYLLSMCLVDRVRKNQGSKTSQTHLRSINSDVFFQAMKVAHAYWELTGDVSYLDSAWHCVERGRSFLLFQAREKIKYFQEKQADFGYGKNSPQLSPGYLPSIEELKAELLEEEAIIQYVSGAGQMNAFVLTKDTLAWIDIGDAIQVEKMVKELRKGLNDYWHSWIECRRNRGSRECLEYEEGLDRYEKMAYAIYERIWEPFQDLIPSTVYVVPDGILHQLPFDVLLSRKPEKAESYRNYPYLIQNYGIGYSYSGSMWFADQKGIPVENGAHLAFAPFAGLQVDSDTLESSSTTLLAASQAPLLYSRSEVESMKSFLDGEVWIGQDATREKVLREASSCRILHISSHARAHMDEPGDSYIILADSVLSLTEIQAWTSPSELVILSACETGLGPYVPGEGGMSLGRAFAEAGARSSLTTLWQVQDRATSIIVQEFYKHLARGDSKVESLRKARLTYLQEHDHRLAHPFFWGGWMLMGNEAPIHSQTIKPDSLLAFLGLGILLAAFFLIGRGIIRRNDKLNPLSKL